MEQLKVIQDLASKIKDVLFGLRSPISSFFGA
jgi:hypothetical protein